MLKPHERKSKAIDGFKLKNVVIDGQKLKNVFEAKSTAKAVSRQKAVYDRP